MITWSVAFDFLLVLSHLRLRKRRKQGYQWLGVLGLVYGTSNIKDPLILFEKSTVLIRVACFLFSSHRCDQPAPNISKPFLLPD